MELGQAAHGLARASAGEPRPGLRSGVQPRPGAAGGRRRTRRNNTRHDDKFRQVHGASYRQVFDLADWDRGLATSTPGQSGQPGSPHYGDLLPLWAEGEYFPLAYLAGQGRGSHAPPPATFTEVRITI